MTFWVPIRASNTVEGRQYMRAVVNPTDERRACSGTPRPQTVQRPALHNGQASPPARACRTSPAPVSLSGANTFWTPTSTRSGRVLGRQRRLARRRQGPRAVAARARHRQPARPTRLVGGGAPDVDPLTTARPYGNLYVRLRIGETGRTSLDCVSGVVAVQDSTIAYNAAATPRRRRRRRRPLLHLGRCRAAFATVAPRATAEVVLVHRRPRQLRRPRDQRVRHRAHGAGPGRLHAGPAAHAQRRQGRHHAARGDAPGPLRQPVQLPVAARRRRGRPAAEDLGRRPGRQHHAGRADRARSRVAGRATLPRSGRRARAPATSRSRTSR